MISFQFDIINNYNMINKSLPYCYKNVKFFNFNTNIACNIKNLDIILFIE